MFGFLKKKEPVVIRDTYGVFVLEKNGRGYRGEVDWLGERISVTLSCDSREGITADKALTALHSLMENAPVWDARLKDRCCEDLSGAEGMVEIWKEDTDAQPVRIPKEKFRENLRMGFVHIHPDGSLFFDLEPGDLFGDHGIGMDADISGTIDGADLFG